MPSTHDLLDRFLEPLSDALAPEAARKLLAIRADAAAQRQIDELAEKCNDGTLTPQERADYESMVAAAGIIAVLQSKARRVLASNPAA